MSLPTPAAPQSSIYNRQIDINKLGRIARRFQNETALVVQDDDLVQEMALFMLTNPWIQYEGYAVRLAKKRAVGVLQREVKHRHVMPAVSSLDRYSDSIFESEYGETEEELSFSSLGNPEAEAIATSLAEDIRRRLTPKCQDVFDHLLSGVEQWEIADKMGLTRARISQMVDTIRTTTTRVLEG